MRRTVAVVSLLAALSLAPSLAHADLLWDVRAGLKGAFTGNLYSEPESTPLGSGLPWDNDQAFIGGGGGLFVELTLLTFLGLEIDLLFEQNAFMERMEWNGGVVEYEIHTNMSQLRVPILVKGRLPLGLVTFTLGVGPELVVGRDAEVSIEALSSPVGTVSDESRRQIEGFYSAKPAGGTFVDVDLGLELSVWKIVIPLALRVGFNMDQPADYDERVTLDQVGNQVNHAELSAIESMHFSLMAGVGYVF
jgi:hypothetical protein